MLVFSKLSREPTVIQWQRDGINQDWMDGLAKNLRSNGRTRLSKTHFSLPWPAENIISHEEVQNADVINLHWVNQFVSPETVHTLLASGKRVWLTLHDQRPFTGGCHYAAGCDGYRKDCAECPQLQPPYHDIPRTSLALSRAVVSAAVPEVIIAPSRWLANEARRSTLFAGMRVECIPYGLDLDVFQPSEKCVARKSFGLPEDALVFLFGAQNLKEPRKGFDLLRKAVQNLLAHRIINSCIRSGKVLFVAFGQTGENLATDDLPVTLVGEQATPEAMAKLLGAVDFFICPSREDNLPNTVLEAMACGVPVIGSDVGGIPDMITDFENGRLVPPDDPDALAAAMVQVIERPDLWEDWGRQARAKCEREYPLVRQAEAYVRLGNELLSAAISRKDTPREIDLGEAVIQAEKALRQAAQRLQAGEIARAKVRELKSQLARLKLELDGLDDQCCKARRQPFWFLSPGYHLLRSRRRFLRREIHNRKTDLQRSKSGTS